MEHVLILTKNTLIEETMVKKLQCLNYEIFCSTDLLTRLNSNGMNPFFGYFRWVLLSETLCHEEVEQVLAQLQRYPVIVLRIAEQAPSEEDQAYWKEKGLADWVAKTISFEEFREKLSVLQRQRQAGKNSHLVSFPKDPLTNSSVTLEMMMKRLSKTEKKVFNCLAESFAQGKVLSRKELCEYLWSEGQTPSNMSQLSCLINKLKRKFEQQGVIGDTITTLWGRGYKLNDDFYDQWVKDQPAAIPLVRYSATN